MPLFVLEYSPVCLLSLLQYEQHAFGSSRMMGDDAKMNLDIISLYSFCLTAWRQMLITMFYRLKLVVIKEAFLPSLHDHHHTFHGQS